MGTESHFIVRMEDLDRSNTSKELAMRQLADLSVVGVRTVDPVVFQSERFHLYNEVISDLTLRGLTYECFCSRREIRESVSAPHGSPATYPGTCRNLSENRRRDLAERRPSALRLRVDQVAHNDRVDDVVLRRNDGVPAYNLAVVVDDALQGVTEVVRGEDLRDVTPSQIYLQSLLGFARPDYVHVPLMVGPDGERLAKRHGGVTLGDCLRLGFSGLAVRRALLRSLEVGSNGWGPSSSLDEWLRSLS